MSVDTRHKSNMKNLTLFTLLVLQIGLIAQGIIPIPVDTTSVWRIARQYNDESCVYHYNSIYYIDGTVMKWGHEYYKVYEEGHFYYSSVNPQYPCTGEWNYSGILRGAIRTEGGKTYGYTEWDNPDLLMDFTLNVGDTLFSSICYEGKIIESIDSVLVGDEYRKRLNFANSWYCNWMIEGVGHQRGIFESMDEPFESESWFICYGENGVPIFGNGNCDITVGQAENLREINNIKIYPNPTYASFSINTSDMQTKIISYLVTDIYGNAILNKNLKLLNQSDFKINLSNCESGVYLLTVIMEDNVKMHKKIIKN